MFDTFLRAMYNFASALLSLAIGFALNFKLRFHSYNVNMGIFDVMEFVSLIALVLIILWIFAIYSRIEE